MLIILLIWLITMGFIVWAIFAWSNNKRERQFAEIERKTRTDCTTATLLLLCKTGYNLE